MGLLRDVQPARLAIPAVTLAYLTFVVAAASGQTGTAATRLSGRVTDATDAAIPGVTVVVTNTATGLSLPSAVTNETGFFLLPAVDPATYRLTASLAGFRTLVMEDVRIVTATPADLKIRLEVGPMSATVTVVAPPETVHTRTTAISSTISTEQIKDLPRITRDALNVLTLLPGVDAGGQHNVRNATRVNGLPQSALVISIDGVYTQAPGDKATFFSQVWANVDAMEEATITMATPGADASAHGAVHIKFTTKSGTNRYAGSVFETWRHPMLNENTFFNRIEGRTVNQIFLNEFGANVGGPIAVPGLLRPGKAFFFVNSQALRLPAEATRTRGVLTPEAASGLFRYTGGAAAPGLQGVNVLTLAAANGQLGASDPIVNRVLSGIASATATQGTISANNDPNTNTYRWNSPDLLTRRFLSDRVDVTPASRHVVSVVHHLHRYSRSPESLSQLDPRFPGLSNQGRTVQYRNSLSTAWRSTFTPAMVNEAIFGLLHTSSDFSIGISAAQFASQGGFSLVLPATGNGVFIGLTSATAGLTGGNGYPNGSGAVAATEGELSWNLSDKLSWQRGRHELQFGGEFFVARYRFTYQPLVPVVTFGFDATSDPARSLFTTASFPGASTANLLDAQYLYALLTGRVSQIYNQLAAQSGTGDYVVNGPTDRRSHLSEAGAFVQDAIRLTPNLTLNAGLRYEVQFPFQPDNSLYSIATVADACGVSGQGPGIGGRPCNFFQPGTLTGVTPTYKQYIAGTNGYQIDFDNVAPSVGIAWLPGVKQGWLRTLLGDPEQATVRAAYAVAYNREGLADLAAPFAANASTTIDHVRSAGNGNLVPAAELPLLVSETSRMGPGAGPAAPQFPLPVVRTSGVNLFEANWRVGAVHSYSAGVQRPISRDTAIEIRYVGTRGVNLLENEDWNEPNLIESGFLDEFRRAQANLYANIAAGRGATFAYSGGSDTSPLPIFLGYFNGSAAAADPSRYTGGNWTSTTFLGFLQRLNPNPLGFLSTGMNGLYGNAGRRANAAAAGLAPNLFVLNPDVNAVTVRTSRGGTRYDGLQIELRRRMARGLSMNINYTLSRTLVARLDTIRSERAYVPALSAVPRSFKLAAMYEVPFGRGRRFGAETSGWVDALAGGWMVSATGKVTSGRVLDFGNVRLIGMTIDELRREFRYRIAPAPPGVRPAATVYVLPQDIIDNTIRAFTIGVNGYTGTPPTGRYFAPANGPDCIQVVRGDCAPKALTVTAPMFSRFDLGLRKQVGLGARRLLSIEIDVLNLFNAINFNPVALPGNPANADGYRVTTSYADVGNTYDPGSRVGQVVLRFNW